MTMYFRTEGKSAIEDLCMVTEHLGYRGAYQQLLLNNGSAVSSLLNFLEDNPDCMKVIFSWIQDNYPEVSDEDDEEDLLDYLTESV